MNLKVALFFGWVAAGILVMQGCSNENSFVGGNTRNVAWTEGGSFFNGAFGWNDSGLLQIALFSGTSCDDMENSVDISNGFSVDPCTLEFNDDGTPFTGTIAGTVCNADDDTQNDHTVTCNNGAATNGTQEVSAEATPTPTPNPQLVLYPVTGLNGNLGGRSGADTLCSNNRPGTVTHVNLRAFISVSATDEIRDMPANYGVSTIKPIAGTNGVVIADDWTDLLDGSIDNTLSAAGFPNGTGAERPWTGSLYDGSEFTEVDGLDNCGGWTHAGSYGVVGNPTLSDGGWLTGSSAAITGNLCDQLRVLMCLAFD